MMQNGAGMEMRETATSENETDPTAARRRQMLVQMLMQQGQRGGANPMMGALAQAAPTLANAFAPQQGGAKTIIG